MPPFDFARFSVRESCPLQQCSSAPTHRHRDFQRLKIGTGRIQYQVWLPEKLRYAFVLDSLDLYLCAFDVYAVIDREPDSTAPPPPPPPPPPRSENSSLFLSRRESKILFCFVFVCLFGKARITKKQHVEKVVKCVTKTAKDYVNEAATRKQDQHIILKVQDTDLAAREAHYRATCRRDCSREDDRYQETIRH